MKTNEGKRIAVDCDCELWYDKRTRLWVLQSENLNVSEHYHGTWFPDISEQQFRKDCTDVATRSLEE